MSLIKAVLNRKEFEKSMDEKSLVKKSLIQISIQKLTLEPFFRVSLELAFIESLHFKISAHKLKSTTYSLLIGIKNLHPKISKTISKERIYSQPYLQTVTFFYLCDWYKIEENKIWTNTFKHDLSVE